MTFRPVSPLGLLGWLLMSAAVLVPLGLGPARVLGPRPDLQWAVANHQFMPRGSHVGEERGYTPGFTLLLSNEGGADTGEVTILLQREPALVELYRDTFEGTGRLSDGADRLRSGDFERTANGAVLRLDPVRPGEEVRVDLFRLHHLEVDAVRDGEAEVAPTELDLTEFPGTPLLPDWAVYSGGLLLAGLAVQNVAMRRRLAGQGSANRAHLGQAAAGRGA